MAHDLRPLFDAVRDQYQLSLLGDHGVAHWARVLDIGERLAGRSGADLAVARRFAVLHDACRLSDYGDPDHGPRAARLAASLRRTLLADLSDRQFTQLRVAIHGHTHIRLRDDVTVQTCWDSDRLDLGRVGVSPHPHYLGTEAARDAEILAWAHPRACDHTVPEWLIDAWQVPDLFWNPDPR